MCVIRVNEGCKVLGALKGVMKNRGVTMREVPQRLASPSEETPNME